MWLKAKAFWYIDRTVKCAKKYQFQKKCSVWGCVCVCVFPAINIFHFLLSFKFKIRRFVSIVLLFLRKREITLSLVLYSQCLIFFLKYISYFCEKERVNSWEWGEGLCIKLSWEHFKQLFIFCWITFPFSWKRIHNYVHREVNIIHKTHLQQLLLKLD